MIMKNRKLNMKKVVESAKRTGLNRSRLAKDLDVSRETVSQWLKGEKFPRPDKPLKLSISLGLNNFSWVNEPEYRSNRKCKLR